MNPINQVLVLLSVICALVIGLSSEQCSFLIGVAVMLVKLGMSTTQSDHPHKFSTLQNDIIQGMPTSLSDALKKFGVDGRFELYAACPTCHFTYKGHALPGNREFYHLPEICTNEVVSKEGTYKCGASLLTKRRDNTLQPIKPFLLPSFTDYIARCLQDPTYLNQCTEATDTALESIRTGNAPNNVQDAFDAYFVRDHKGPDGKLFVDRGNKIRLAFSIHTDFFNPKRITHRGLHASVGVVSCANLALDSSIRYLPEYLYTYLIPGPHEPDYDQLDHYLRPTLEKFVEAWRPGMRVSRTANSELGVVVEAGIFLSVNDLPAARKAAGFMGTMSNFICTVCNLHGTHHIFSCDHKNWPRRDISELRRWSEAYRDARTHSKRTAIVKNHGVRWSSFWLLEYWDPTRMLVIDAMHCILEGVVHYHCRHVLRLDASATQISADGFKYAFDWPWTLYDNETVPEGLKIPEKQVLSVIKVQKALSLAISGDKALTLEQLWSRLENQGTLASLKFVAHTLELPTTLHNLSAKVSMMHVQRACRTSKKPESIRAPTGVALTKSHFIALLLDWVSKISSFKEPFC